MSVGFEVHMRQQMADVVQKQGEIVEALTALNNKVGVQNGRVTKAENDIADLKRQVGALPTGDEVAAIVGQELDDREVRKKVERYDAVVDAVERVSWKVVAALCGSAGAGAVVARLLT